ncbi:MAG: hypothetical protein PVH31_04965 [Ectothiorhodospiraceae bacterium]|jgi:hypothetical protein
MRAETQQLKELDDNQRSEIYRRMEFGPLAQYARAPRRRRFGDRSRQRRG